jgi:16S rRNA (guanine527-N7)-methyltransferase
MAPWENGDVDVAGSRLRGVLLRSRQLGFLGPGPVEEHVVHAEHFAEGLGLVRGRLGPAMHVADLGAGGGLPGLPLLVGWPEVRATLIDASQKRCSFLVWAAVELGVVERAGVVCARAEDLGHDERYRGTYDAVVARGFAGPASTVECAAALLRLGGRCVVSEPPGGRRWPADGLRRAGLVESDAPDGVAVLVRRSAIPDELPRPFKDQRREPLFDL